MADGAPLVCHLPPVTSEDCLSAVWRLILSQKQSHDLWALCAINSGAEIVTYVPGIIHPPKNWDFIRNCNLEEWAINCGISVIYK